jgi:hypothetical protein
LEFAKANINNYDSLFFLFDFGDVPEEAFYTLYDNGTYEAKQILLASPECPADMLVHASKVNDYFLDIGLLRNPEISEDSKKELVLRTLKSIECQGSDVTDKYLVDIMLPALLFCCPTLSSSVLSFIMSLHLSHKGQLYFIYYLTQWLCNNDKFTNYEEKDNAEIPIIGNIAVDIETAIIDITFDNLSFDTDWFRDSIFPSHYGEVVSWSSATVYRVLVTSRFLSKDALDYIYSRVLEHRINPKYRENAERLITYMAANSKMSLGILSKEISIDYRFLYYAAQNPTFSMEMIVKAVEYYKKVDKETLRNSHPTLVFLYNHQNAPKFIRAVLWSMYFEPFGASPKMSDLIVYAVPWA